MRTGGLASSGGAPATAWAERPAGRRSPLRGRPGPGRDGEPRPAGAAAPEPPRHQVREGCTVRLSELLRGGYQGYGGGSLRGEDVGVVTDVSEQDGRPTALVEGPHGVFLYWQEHIVVVDPAPTDKSLAEVLSVRSDDALYGAPDDSGEGGYLRLVPGDVLDGDIPLDDGDSVPGGGYRLVRRLGRGQSATVWLARDLSPGAGPAYVAIKVTRCTELVRRSTGHEIGLLYYIARESPLPRRGIDIGTSRLLKHFEHRGPHGVHVCMVFEVLGPTLDALMRRNHYEGLKDLGQVKDIVISILRALDELASLRVVHTDLKPENILLRTPTGKVLREMAGDAEPLADSICSHSTDGCGDDDFPIGERHVKLSDVGLSYLLQPADEPKPSGEPLTEEDRQLIWASNYKKGAIIQTREYRAPEIIIGDHFTPKTDIWSLACVAYELVTGRFLFDPKVHAHVVDEHSMDVQHLSEMLQVLRQLGVGDPPEEMVCGEGCYVTEFFEPSTGAFLHSHAVQRTDVREPLSRRLKDEEEVNDLMDFLRVALQWVPSQRPCAADLMCHRWLRSRTIAEAPRTPAVTPVPTPRPILMVDGAPRTDAEAGRVAR